MQNVALVGWNLGPSWRDGCLDGTLRTVGSGSRRPHGACALGCVGGGVVDIRIWFSPEHAGKSG